MEQGLGAHNSIAQWAVGLLYLGLGQREAAATRLEAVSSPAPGPGHPFVALHALPDLVEKQGAPEWQLALAARCRALTTRPLEAKERL